MDGHVQTIRDVTFPQEAVPLGSQQTPTLGQPASGSSAAGCWQAVGGPTENRTRATLPAISGSHGNSRSTTLETLKNGRHTAKLQPSFIILLREPSSLTSWTHGIQLGGVSQKGMEKKNVPAYLVKDTTFSGVAEKHNL